MNKHCLLALVFVLTLGGCESREQAQVKEPESTMGAVNTISSSAQTGRQVASDLTARYNDLRRNCGSESMPSFLCTGIVLRSTVPSFTNAYSTWNPSPHSQTSGGVSFTYLRKDMKFKSLVFGQTSGFIFYPVLSRPVGSRQIQILCAYPRDGATQLREKPGCGAHPYSPDRSRRCQTIGITTAEQWVANINSGKWNICPFDVQDSMNNLAADSFYQTIRAHNLKNYFAGAYDYSELILANWPQNIPEELPIEAFYYLPGGLAGAQHDQKDFFNKTGGKVVPIIKLTLPATTDADAAFTYSAADQVH